jgi:hypothetical protein
MRGYTLANAGQDTRGIQDYLGHVDIQHTFRYTELSPTKFKDFWKSHRGCMVDSALCHNLYTCRTFDLAHGPTCVASVLPARVGDLGRRDA